MEGIEDPGLVPNIKMQKTGARVEFGAVCPLPASDLGRCLDRVFTVVVSE